MTTEELKKLSEEIYSDSQVSKKEVKKVWDIKDFEEDLPTGFTDFFVKVNMDWLSVDGGLDLDKAEFLISHILNDEEIDESEHCLLTAISNAFKNNTLKVCSWFKEDFDEYF